MTTTQILFIIILFQSIIIAYLSIVILSVKSNKPKLRKVSKSELKLCSGCYYKHHLDKCYRDVCNKV